MSPKRTGMHFLFCFVDLALIAPNIRWIRRFSAAAQHLIMVHFNLSPLKGELLAKGFAGCLFKPFSISELMEVSDRCAIKATPDGKPDFSALLSYGNEAVMLEKLITETEKEMQAVRDAAKEKDLQKLDSLIHHLRSSWEVLRADQPLNVLYGLLRGDALPDGEALSHAVTAVLDKGVEIIRLAEEERRKYEDE